MTAGRSTRTRTIIPPGVSCGKVSALESRHPSQHRGAVAGLRWKATTKDSREVGGSPARFKKQMSNLVSERRVEGVIAAAKPRDGDLLDSDGATMQASTSRACASSRAVHEALAGNGGHKPSGRVRAVNERAKGVRRDAEHGVASPVEEGADVKYQEHRRQEADEGAKSHSRLKPSLIPSQPAIAIARSGRTIKRIASAGALPPPSRHTAWLTPNQRPDTIK